VLVNEVVRRVKIDVDYEPGEPRRLIKMNQRVLNMLETETITYHPITQFAKPLAPWVSLSVGISVSSETCAKLTASVVSSEAV
jgi:hypothetical protein